MQCWKICENIGLFGPESYWPNEGRICSSGEHRIFLHNNHKKKVAQEKKVTNYTVATPPHNFYKCKTQFHTFILQFAVGGRSWF